MTGRYKYKKNVVQVAFPWWVELSSIFMLNDVFVENGERSDQWIIPLPSLNYHEGRWTWIFKMTEQISVVKYMFDTFFCM